MREGGCSTHAPKASMRFLRMLWCTMGSASVRAPPATHHATRGGVPAQKGDVLLVSEGGSQRRKA